MVLQLKHGNDWFVTTYALFWKKQVIFLCLSIFYGCNMLVINSGLYNSRTLTIFYPKKQHSDWKWLLKCPTLLQKWYNSARIPNFETKDIATINWAASNEFVSSSISSWQILTAHAQPFRGARDLAFPLKVPLESLNLRCSHRRWVPNLLDTVQLFEGTDH